METTHTYTTCNYTLWADHSCIITVITEVIKDTKAIIKVSLIAYAAHIIQEDRSSSRTNSIASKCCKWYRICKSCALNSLSK